MIENIYTTRDDCRLCHSKDVQLVLPLKPMPIATPNFKLTDLDRNTPLFRQGVPMDLYLCSHCGLLQIINIGNAHIQFDNYVYTTSSSLGLTKHFQGYADAVHAQFSLPKGALVVEMGSNDGTLLGFFKEKGYRVQGCDPAIAIAKAATERGIPTMAAFFDQNSAAAIKNEHGEASLVIANNMIANVDNLFDLVSGVRNILSDNGVFVFETQYGLDVLTDNLLDTVYHEHLSYFTIKPLIAYFHQFDMHLIDVLHVPTKGGSIRVSVQKNSGSRQPTPAVQAFLDREEQIGCYRKSLYDSLTNRIAQTRERLHEMIRQTKKAGKKVAGYGVSVGTSTLLAQFELESVMDMLFDDNPARDHFCSGPGYDLPVYGPDELAHQAPGLVIIFAWRYAEPILEKHRAFAASSESLFVVPLPDLKVIN